MTTNIIRATVERLYPVKLPNGAVRTRPGRYSLTIDATGEVIVPDAKCPTLDACRVLVARGVTGTLEVWWKGATFAATRTNIEKGALWTVRETVTDGPRFVRWRPFEMSPGVVEDEEFHEQHDREMVPA